MKIYLNQFKRSRGSVLLFAVMTMGLVSGLIAVYMTLVQNQNRATMRSQAWNATVPIIEAGIEEAMAHLAVNGVGNLGNDGWLLIGGQYTKYREVGDGFFVVGISNVSDPVISSQGYVSLPLVASASPNMMFAATGGTLGTTHMARGVKVTASAGSLFAKGLVAKGQINMNGNNIEADSFDSTDSLYSTGGQYDAAKRKDNGDVATNSGLVNSLSVGNANIYGKVSTGPGGSVSIGNNGAVGDASWHAGGNSGIQSGASSDDMNVSFPDVDPPFSGAFTPSSGTYGGNNYDYVLSGGNYELSSLSLNSSDGMIITGDSTLYVTGDVALSGQSFIQIESGATLKLYVGGASASLGGGGVINHSGNATNFQYYGLPSNTALSISGNGELAGLIYAPDADLSLNGGGRSQNDVIGASITKTVTMNGHFKFHYDEALKNFGAEGRMVVSSWREMNPTELSLLSSVAEYYRWYGSQDVTQTETTDGSGVAQ